MITSDDVLKAIVECRKPNGLAYHTDVMNKLEIDGITLSNFIKKLNTNGYISSTLGDIEVTSLGLSAYDDLARRSKAKKSLSAFSKLSLKFIAEIIATIVAGIALAYITYHFGWK